VGAEIVLHEDDLLDLGCAGRSFRHLRPEETAT
jgi:hypothetical protein